MKQFIAICILLSVSLTIYAQKQVRTTYWNGNVHELYNVDAQGNKQGKYTAYYQNGKVETVLNFKNDQLHGVCSWYEGADKPYLVQTYANGIIVQIERFDWLYADDLTKATQYYCKYKEQYVDGKVTNVYKWNYKTNKLEHYSGPTKNGYFVNSFCGVYSINDDCTNIAFGYKETKHKCDTTYMWFDKTKAQLRAMFVNNELYIEYDNAGNEVFNKIKELEALAERRKQNELDRIAKDSLDKVNEKLKAIRLQEQKDSIYNATVIIPHNKLKQKLNIDLYAKDYVVEVKALTDKVAKKIGKDFYNALSTIDVAQNNSWMRNKTITMTALSITKQGNFINIVYGYKVGDGANAIPQTLYIQLNDGSSYDKVVHKLFGIK